MGLPRGLLGGPWEGLFGPWARPIWPSWRPISWFLRLGSPIWGSQGWPRRPQIGLQKGPILGPIPGAQITLTPVWELKSSFKKGLPGGPK